MLRRLSTSADALGASSIWFGEGSMLMVRLLVRFRVTLSLLDVSSFLDADHPYG